MDPVIHAERALLGAVLSDPAGRQSVLRFIQPDDFYRPWHGQVLAAMRRLAGRGLAPGPQQVYAELKHDPDLPLSVSHDAVRLADLMHACPRASHAPAYAGLVIGARTRRELALHGGRMRQAAEAPDAGPAGDEALEQARLVVARARRDLAVSRGRWVRLPEAMRRELPVPVRDSGADAEIARRAGWLRDELARLREDLWAQDSDRLAGQLAVIARELAENAAGLARVTGHPGGDAGSLAVRPDDAAAQAAGCEALRDLVAGAGRRQRHHRHAGRRPAPVFRRQRSGV